MSALPRTLVDLFAAATSGPDRDLVAQRDARGEWAMTRSHALRARVAAAASGLRAAGIQTGDRVAIMSPNRVDWIVAQLAILHAGAVAVPLYATQAHDQIRHILSDSEARLLFVDSPQTRATLVGASIALPPTISFDTDPAGDLATLEATGRSATATFLDQIAAGLDADDLAVLIYTSGTTGQPKGVMLTHRNIASNAVAAFASVAGVIGAGDPVLSILPYAHIYESTNLFGYYLRGCVVYVNTKLESVLDDLREIKPVMVLAVPRIFERILVSMVTKAKAGGGVRARLVPWGLATGRDYMRAKAAGKAIGLPLAAAYRLARALVLAKVRPLLGLSNLRFFGSGSARLHPDTAFTFAAFGIPIAEGYGLTECSPVVTVNSPLNPAIGTVGMAIEQVELRLADDGELLVRGPGVMKGYYRDPAATERAITDGWLHTGDIAVIQSDGNVRIVDRKNELFKTSGGKYIAPARIESALLRSIYFNQAMVFGAGRAHPAALVSPNWTALRAELHLPDDAPTSELATHPVVVHFLHAQALLATGDLATFEQIRSVGILARDLTIEDGELSPTQKIRRRIVERRYDGLIDAPVTPAPRSATNDRQRMPTAH